MALQTAALPTSQEGHSSACTSHTGSGHKPSPRYSSKRSAVQVQKMGLMGSIS